MLAMLMSYKYAALGVWLVKRGIPAMMLLNVTETIKRGEG